MSWMKLVHKIAKVRFPQVSLAEVDFQMGAEKCVKCADIPRLGVRNRWVRDVGMWIMRMKSLDVKNNCARSGCEEFLNGCGKNA